MAIRLSFSPSAAASTLLRLGAADQPRVPAGSPAGGQFASKGGAGGGGGAAPVAAGQTITDDRGMSWTIAGGVERLPQRTEGFEWKANVRPAGLPGATPDPYYVGKYGGVYRVQPIFSPAQKAALRRIVGRERSEYEGGRLRPRDPWATPSIQATAQEILTVLKLGASDQPRVPAGSPAGGQFASKGGGGGGGSGGYGPELTGREMAGISAHALHSEVMLGNQAYQFRGMTHSVNDRGQETFRIDGATTPLTGSWSGLGSGKPRGTSGSGVRTFSTYGTRTGARSVTLTTLDTSRGAQAQHAHIRSTLEGRGITVRSGGAASHRRQVVARRRASSSGPALPTWADAYGGAGT